MKTLAITLSLIAAVALTATFYLRYRLNNAPDEKDLEAVIDSEMLKLRIADRSYSLVIGVFKDGESFIKGYGTVSKESGAAADASTVFQIASVSKLFTASMLQLLCDEGVVKMDDTLGALIGDTVALSTAAREVTLKQLVTHTSGFPSIPKPLESAATKLVAKENLMQNPYAHLGPEYIFEYLKTTEDKREPGKFEYSNFGMGLLGHVLEIVTKRNFESLVSEKILAPLNMGHTAITLTPQMTLNLAQGYTDSGEPAPLWTFRALAGAGAFNSNVNDMMRFVRANIEGGSAMSQTFKKMHVPQFGGDTGIGWMQPTFIDRFVGNQSVVWHNGLVGGYASYVSIDTKAKTGLVILSSKALDVTLLGMMLTRQVRTQSWATLHAF